MAFAELSSIVMGEGAAKAGLVTSRQKIHNAIHEILRFFGFDIVPVPDIITDVGEYLNFCLKPSGIMKRKVELTGKWWLDAFGPMLGTLDNDELVALIPGAKGYGYFDYESGKRVVINSKNAGNLKTTAYCFYKPFPARELSILDLVKYIFSTVTRGDIFFYLFIMTVTTLLGLVQPRITLLLYSYIIPQGDMGLLFSLCFLMVTIAAATQILSISQQLIMERLTKRLANTIEPAAMMRILNLPAEFFKKYAAGELSEKFAVIPTICNSIFSVITGTLITSLFSLAYFTQIANITPALLVPSMLIITVTLVLNIITTIYSMRIQKRQMLALADLSGITYSTLSGIQKIKL